MRKTLILTTLLIATTASGQVLQSPERFFGFAMGSDRKLIDWEQITSYFNYLDESSDKLKLVELGRTTLGRQMLMAIIASKDGLANLENHRTIQRKLARPFNLGEEEAGSLIQKGKLIFLITLNIHSTEIAASQESVELAYEFVVSDDPKIQKILENVIILLVPSLNPDGQDMIAKWYLKDVGTPYEGGRMPMKYHHYADHDNNRDWFFFNLAESRHVAKVLYHDWYPEIVLDQHQMGSSGARLFLPPYADPVNPNVPPALMANVNFLGKYVIADLHDQGFRGLVTGTIFNAFFEGTMSKTPLWHNRIGILTEAASVRVASPIFFPRTSLRGMGIDLPEYEQQTNFLDPWPGGWWRLRDIIELEKAATYSMLELAAIHKEKFKRNFYQLNRQAIQKGLAEAPYAYVIPLEQHDPNSAVEMLRRLCVANVAVHRADEDFTTPEGDFSQGDFIVRLAQPSRAYIKDLLEPQRYPNLSEYPEGPPRQPYDVTGWTLPYQFGVTAVPIETHLDIAMTPVEPKLEIKRPAGASTYRALERRYLNAYKMVNALLKQKRAVFTSQEKIGKLPPGSFLVSSLEDDSELHELSQKYEVPLRPVALGDEYSPVQLKPARVALYQPWIPWAYDEGWTRLILDNFEFSYSVLHNEDFRGKRAELRNFDVIIFGSQETSRIVDGKGETEQEPVLGEPIPHPSYAGGIGTKGIDNLRDFIQKGGTVLFFGDACNFAIEKLNLPAANVLKDTERSDYFAPGSIFRMHLKSGSSLTLGMPGEAYVYKNRPLVFALKMYDREILETGFFGERQLLQSGWVVGERHLHKKVALAEIPVGKGLVILYGFRVQHRGQTYGTFRLLFNALYRS